jgi:two-component system, response regulator
MSHRELLAILYAEDDPDDRLLAEIAHRESGIVNPLVFVSNGEEALEYLRRSGRHSDRTDAPETGIVLLDLNMPGMGGRETLNQIKADRVLRRTPVVILTTSSAQVDITASYDAGANSYIVKPSAFGSLVQLFDGLSSYWFDLNSLARAASR